MGHEPFEYTKQLITLIVKKMFPKVCPEICRNIGDRKKAQKNLLCGTVITVTSNKSRKIVNLYTAMLQHPCI